MKFAFGEPQLQPFDVALQHKRVMSEKKIVAYHIENVPYVCVFVHHFWNPPCVPAAGVNHTVYLFGFFFAVVQAAMPAAYLGKIYKESEELFEFFLSFSSFSSG